MAHEAGAENQRTKKPARGGLGGQGREEGLSVYMFETRDIEQDAGYRKSEEHVHQADHRPRNELAVQRLSLHAVGDNTASAADGQERRRYGEVLEQVVQGRRLPVLKRTGVNYAEEAKQKQAAKSQGSSGRIGYGRERDANHEQDEPNQRYEQRRRRIPTTRVMGNSFPSLIQIRHLLSPSVGISWWKTKPQFVHTKSETGIPIIPSSAMAISAALKEPFPSG